MHAVHLIKVNRLALLANMWVFTILYVQVHTDTLSLLRRLCMATLADAVLIGIITKKKQYCVVLLCRDLMTKMPFEEVALKILKMYDITNELQHMYDKWVCKCPFILSS